MMQIIPETMFTVLHQIIEIQTHRIKEVTKYQITVAVNLSIGACVCT